MKVHDVVDAWQVIAHREMGEGLPVNHCILGTRTVIEVARRLGWDAEAVPCETIVANSTAAGLIAAGVPTGEWPPDAWSVGASMQSPGEGYPGHLVAVVHDGEQRWLVDSSTAQFVRPQHGILPDIAMASTIPDEGWPVDGTAILYKAPTWQIAWMANSKLGNLHRSAPDWRMGRTEYVDEILHTLTNVA